MTSCGVVHSPFIPGSEAAAAKDQIMVVRRDPPSLGFLRLQTQSQNHHDLGVFVKIHGVPDFLAETGNHERRFFILYYLEHRKAYACRTQLTDARMVEFAGPYPITPREYKILSGYRNGPEKTRTSSAE